MYSKTCVKRPHPKRPKIGFQEKLSLNADQKYCRRERSAILLTFIKLPSVIKIFVLSTFEWPFYTGFTVNSFLSYFYKYYDSVNSDILAKILFSQIALKYNAVIAPLLQSTSAQNSVSIC